MRPRALLGIKTWFARLLALALLAGGGALQASRAADPAFVIVPPAPPQVQLYADTDITTHQISTGDASDYQACAAKCVGEAMCKAFTFKDKFKTCYLHGSAEAPARYPGAVSGIVLSRTPPPPALGGATIIAPGVVQLAPTSSCSMASTSKCPGCSVTCQSGQKAVCTPPSDGILEACLSNSRCECKPS